MQAKSFIEILSNELRKEIRAEVEAELLASRAAKFSGPAARVEASHKAESVELWLNLKMGGALSSGSQSIGHSVNRYQPSKKQSVVRQLSSATAVAEPCEVKERVGRAVTIEQTLAVEFFRREGSSLVEKFTETQLKSEFRKIAMRIHPDRHPSASVEQLKSLSSRFQTLVESAEILEATLN